MKKTLMMITAITALCLLAGCASTAPKGYIGTVSKGYIGNDRNCPHFLTGDVVRYTFKPTEGKEELFVMPIVEARKGKKVKNVFPIQYYIKATLPTIYIFYRFPDKDKSQTYKDDYRSAWMYGISLCPPEEFQKVIAGKYFRIKDPWDVYGTGYTTSSVNLKTRRAAFKEVEKVINGLANMAHHQKELAVKTHKKLFDEAKLDSAGLIDLIREEQQ